MLHSFSHMLMHELAYYSGFSVNELAEKIYFMDSPISTTAPPPSTPLLNVRRTPLHLVPAAMLELGAFP